MAILAVKLRNRFKNSFPTLEVRVKNIRVNGDVRGCSGFITDPETGRHVYVNTERSVYGPLQNRILYRTAESTTDYTGGRNRWSTDADIVHDVTDLLREQ